MRRCLPTCLARYGPAEIACTAVAVACAGIAAATGAGAEAVCVGGTVAEVCAFYAVMIAQERAQRGPDAPLGAVLRSLALEFGPAEVLDTFLLRPALLYAAIALTGGAASGALLGKVAADAAFYALAVASRSLASRRTATVRFPHALSIALGMPVPA
jgi:hypothetical protein